MLFKEDVLSIGQMVERMVDETAKLMRSEASATLKVVQDEELKVNRSDQEIEEKCLDLLREKDLLAEKEIGRLVVSTIISAKFERMADHAHRAAKIADWAHEDQIEIPAELIEMSKVVLRMVQGSYSRFRYRDCRESSRHLAARQRSGLSGRSFIQKTTVRSR